MSLQVGELYAKLVLDKGKFGSDLKSAEGQAKGWGSRAGASFANAGKMILKSFALIGAAVLAFGAISMQNAVEQERANFKVDAAFGESAKAVNDWAASNAAALGVNDDVLQSSIAQYGLWAKNVGYSNKEAIAQGEEMATRAAQISLATGESYETVFGKLMKGAQGSTRGLNGFGVAIDTNIVKQKALEMGLYSGKGALDEQARAAATHALIMEQTAKYTGIAADMQDSLALKNKRMGVIIDSVMDAVGTIFLSLVDVLMGTVIPIFQSLADAVNQHLPAIQTLVGQVMDGIKQGFDTVVSAVGPFVEVLLQVAGEIVKFLEQGKNMEYVLQALGVVVAVAIVPPFLMWAAATVIALAPIILLVAAVAGIIALLDQLGILTQIVEVGTRLFGQAMEWITVTVLPLLSEAFNNIVAVVMPLLQGAFAFLTDTVLPAVGAAFGFITDNILPLFGQAFQWISDNILPIVRDAIAFITDTVLPAFGAAIEWISNDILPHVMTVLRFFGDVARQVFDFLTNVVIPLFTDAIRFILDTVRAVLPHVQNAFKIMGDILKGVVDFIVNAFKVGFDFLKNVVFPGLKIAADLLGAGLKIVFDAIKIAFDILKGAFDLGAKAIKIVFDGIKIAADLLGGGLRIAFDLIKMVVDIAVKAIQAGADIIGQAWNGLVGIFRTVADTISGIVKGGFNFVIGLINGVIDLINSIQIHIPFIGVGDVGIGPFDWNGLQIPRLAYLAKGLWEVPGVMPAMLHQGEAVLPKPAADEYRRGRAGFGDRSGDGGIGGPLIGTQIVNGMMPDEVERQTRRAIRREAMGWGFGRTSGATT